MFFTPVTTGLSRLPQVFIFSNFEYLDFSLSAFGQGRPLVGYRGRHPCDRVARTVIVRRWMSGGGRFGVVADALWEPGVVSEPAAISRRKGDCLSLLLVNQCATSCQQCLYYPRHRHHHGHLAGTQPPTSTT